MTFESAINSTAEEQHQQNSGDSSLIKSSIQDEVEKKSAFDIVEGEMVGTNETRVVNAVITGWQLNLVLLW
jgi:hypothetical protein